MHRNLVLSGILLENRCRRYRTMSSCSSLASIPPRHTVKGSSDVWGDHGGGASGVEDVMVDFGGEEKEVSSGGAFRKTRLVHRLQARWLSS